SAHGLERGNVARSSSTTSTPRSASNAAVVDPAGPAPIMTTSWIGFSGLTDLHALHPVEERATNRGCSEPGRQQRSGRTAGSRRDQVHPVVVQPFPPTYQPRGLTTPM